MFKFIELKLKKNYIKNCLELWTANISSLANSRHLKVDNCFSWYFAETMNDFQQHRLTKSSSI